MGLKNFFINCLNRRSFQFLNFVGVLNFVAAFLLLAIIGIILFYFSNDEVVYGVIAFIWFLSAIISTFGLASIISIIIIYLKLLKREYVNPEYRIKNKFLTENPVYVFFAFIFYIFAIVSMAGLLYLACITLDVHKTDVFNGLINIYLFIIYILILIFIIKKV